jgi:hypothetical protein
VNMQALNRIRDAGRRERAQWKCMKLKVEHDIDDDLHSQSRGRRRLRLETSGISRDTDSGAVIF